MAKKWFGFWQKADSGYSLMNWVGWIVAILFPGTVGALVAWAASYRDWIWNDYGMLGILGIGIVAALLVSLVFLITASAIKLYRSTNTSGEKAEPIPSVSKWMSPTEAIKEFGDRSLQAEADRAAQKCNELFEKQHALSTDRTQKILRSEYNALDAMMSGHNKNDPLTLVTQEYNDSQINAVLAKNKLNDNLLQQLRDGTLIAKGVRVEGDKVHEDWELIKSAYWVALTFVSHDQKLETVSGGGKVFKGLKIGKPKK
jgi:hypothetical protein